MLGGWSQLQKTTAALSTEDIRSKSGTDSLARHNSKGVRKIIGKHMQITNLQNASKCLKMIQSCFKIPQKQSLLLYRHFSSMEDSNRQLDTSMSLDFFRLLELSTGRTQNLAQLRLSQLPRNSKPPASMTVGLPLPHLETNAVAHCSPY